MNRRRRSLQPLFCSLIFPQNNSHNLIGLVVRGSIGTYRTRCGSPRCPCATDRLARHGPYHIWTRKEGGKTITRMLSDQQASRLRPWIQNMRRLDALLKKLQKLGLQAAQAVPRS